MNESAYGHTPVLNITTVIRNRVLRNTYWLLALSMLPTVLGAYLGWVTGFSRLAASHPTLSMIAYIAVASDFLIGIERRKNSAKCCW